MRTIKVKLAERSYDIHVGEGLLGKAGALLGRLLPGRRSAVLSTREVYRTHGTALVKSLKRSGFQVHPILIPDGEAHKNEKTLFTILKEMTRLGFQRDSVLVVLGGGVAGDLGGLASSLYMRGIAFVQCPTTLLAQVDASVGGKTAIDYAGIKNLVGAFHQPRMVLVDTSVLSTLDDRNLKTGLAEVVKCGVIRDEKLFRTIEENADGILKRDRALLGGLIRRSCEIKAEIVSNDEREGGQRAWLNYGHTLGHALESYFGYSLLTHGEAITYGMWFASRLSFQMGLCSEGTVLRQVRLFKRLDLLRKVPRFDTRKLIEKMSLDKKARGGKIQFVLTRKIGLVTIQKSIAPSLILSSLNQFQSELSE